VPSLPPSSFPVAREHCRNSALSRTSRGAIAQNPLSRPLRDTAQYRLAEIRGTWRRDRPSQKSPLLQTAGARTCSTIRTSIALVPPTAGLSLDGTRWVSCPAGFFLGRAGFVPAASSGGLFLSIQASFRGWGPSVVSEGLARASAGRSGLSRLWPRACPVGGSGSSMAKRPAVRGPEAVLALSLGGPPQRQPRRHPSNTRLIGSRTGGSASVLAAIIGITTTRSRNERWRPTTSSGPSWLHALPTGSTGKSAILYGLPRQTVILADKLAPVCRRLLAAPPLPPPHTAERTNRCQRLFATSLRGSIPPCLAASPKMEAIVAFSRDPAGKPLGPCVRQRLMNAARRFPQIRRLACRRPFRLRDREWDLFFVAPALPCVRNSLPAVRRVRTRSLLFARWQPSAKSTRRRYFGKSPAAQSAPTAPLNSP